MGKEASSGQSQNVVCDVDDDDDDDDDVGDDSAYF